MCPGWICTTLKVKVGLPAMRVAPTETTWPRSSHQALIQGHLLRLLTEVDKAGNLLPTGGSEEQNSNFQDTFRKPELSMQILSLGGPQHVCGPVYPQKRPQRKASLCCGKLRAPTSPNVSKLSVSRKLSLTGMLTFLPLEVLKERWLRSSGDIQ